MPKHPHPADARLWKNTNAYAPDFQAAAQEESQGYTQGVDTTLDLTVTLSRPHPGALPLVRATGHGAEALRDAVLEVLARNCADGLSTRMASEVSAIFGHAPDCQLDRTALRAALNEVKQGLARALAQVPE